MQKMHFANKYLNEMKKISQITRTSIVDALILQNLSWSGNLDEEEFLSRLYDLDKMPSHDGRFKNAKGDIWQHRVNNSDGSDSWILSDSRLKMNEDEFFLKFLCETIHPVVRRESDEVIKILKIINEYLTKDGYELIEKEKISGRPIFISRKKSIDKIILQESSKKIKDVLSDEYVIKQIELMDNSIEEMPSEAIGKAKELIETICLKILEEKKITTDRDWDLIKLLKHTTKNLNLTPEEIDDSNRGAESIRKILGSLVSIVHGLSELRNQYGSGHGKKPKFKGLSSRHAKLAVGSAQTLAIFLLETHKLKK
jgi:hypothetical protein